MKNIISFIIVVMLIAFDLLEPIFRSKQLYFGIKIESENQKNTIYRDYLKKVVLITLPIGIFLWHYYPIEENLLGFFGGFLIMVILNLIFYFTARKAVKNNK